MKSSRFRALLIVALSLAPATGRADAPSKRAVVDVHMHAGETSMRSAGRGDRIMGPGELLEARS